MKEKEYLTKEKFEALKEELHTLKTEKRKEIAEKLEYARSLGDLSENAEYHDARSAQAEIEARIDEISHIFKHAEIITHRSSDIVFIGSIVTLKKEKDGTKITYQIFGSEEADISSNKLSNKSPLGMAIMGKKKGDEVTLKTPKGNVNYVIVDIK